MTDSPSSSHVHGQHLGLPFSRPATPGVSPPQVGFLGLGSMGYPMARNLASHKHTHLNGSHPLLVYNRSKAKCEQMLQELGPDKIKIADSPEQLAKECDVIITSLANDDVVKSVYTSFKKALSEIPPPSKPKIFVETSTTYPELAGELDNLISDFPHTHLICCPVFGPPVAAEKAALVIVMAGDYRSKKEVAYLLVPAVGRKVIDLGGNLEKAPVLKLIGNSLILGALEVISESITLGEKAGIGAETVLGVIKDMFPNTPMANYGAKMVADDFDGLKGFALDGGLKDARHIRRLTSDLNSPMPMIDIAHQHMLTARAIHETQKAAGDEKYEVLDWSALVAGVRTSAGLEGLDSKKGTRLVRKM